MTLGRSRRGRHQDRSRRDAYVRRRRVNLMLTSRQLRDAYRHTLIQIILRRRNRRRLVPYNRRNRGARQESNQRHRQRLGKTRNTRVTYTVSKHNFSRIAQRLLRTKARPRSTRKSIRTSRQRGRNRANVRRTRITSFMMRQDSRNLRQGNRTSRR